MTIRIIIGLCAMLAVTNGASAAIWEWGCQGQLGDQQVIFNRESLVVVDTKRKLGDIRKLRTSKIELPPGEPLSVGYNPKGDDGLEKTMEFTGQVDPKSKLTLTEISSRRISHRHKVICGRDEDTDIFDKTYRFKLDNAPAREFKMQCKEYQLSTRGGRACN